MTAFGHFALPVAALIVAAGMFFTPGVVTSSHLDRVPAVLTVDVELTADPRDMDDARDEPDPGANGFVDLYGNEVTDAIATYTFDHAGSLYELHSPQTELPRLGIPKS